MESYYKILGINSSATDAEIRRAYRILARRYHPDVNPGLTTAEKFQAISLAYETLRDTEKRKQYDLQLQHQQANRIASKLKTYQEQQRQTAQQRYFQAQKADYAKIRELERQKAAQATKESIPTAFKSLKKLKLGEMIGRSATVLKKITSPGAADLATIIEVSITVQDAIHGIRKTVEIDHRGSLRKINVRIPPGVHNGSVIRMRSTSAPQREVILIVRIAKHPFLTVNPKGLLLELPISVSEAVNGANIQVPTLSNPVVLKIPPGTQSGTEFRLREKGITSPDGIGDLFVRIIIQIPEGQDAISLGQKIAELEAGYSTAIRSQLPKSLTSL